MEIAKQRSSFAMCSDLLPGTEGGLFPFLIVGVFPQQVILLVHDERVPESTPERYGAM
jgi:hypothetical protein